VPLPEPRAQEEADTADNLPINWPCCSSRCNKWCRHLDRRCYNASNILCWRHS